MIRILAKEYSQAVSCLCEKLNKQSAQFDVYLSQDGKQLADRLIESNTSSALILVGNTWSWCETFAEAFGLALVYDKFAEKKVADKKEEKELQSYAKSSVDTKRTVVQADSMEELIKKISAVNWENVKAEKTPENGSRFDYSI